MNPRFPIPKPVLGVPRFHARTLSGGLQVTMAYTGGNPRLGICLSESDESRCSMQKLLAFSSSSLTFHTFSVFF